MERLGAVEPDVFGVAVEDVFHAEAEGRFFVAIAEIDVGRGGAAPAAGGVGGGEVVGALGEQRERRGERGREVPIGAGLQLIVGDVVDLLAAEGGIGGSTSPSAMTRPIVSAPRASISSMGA